MADEKIHGELNLKEVLDFIDDNHLCTNPGGTQRKEEKVQQIYFHKWSITADALKLCLIFIKRDFIRNCLGIISIVVDTETEIEREKKKHEKEKGGQKGKGERRRIEWRKERRMKRIQDNILLLHLQKCSYYQPFLPKGARYLCLQDVFSGKCSSI
ncbi:hypothetical protein AMECASPLE_031924 [Ameca splendens]|uniref:Uncharacterized protein n=1 Tax=Ameca splendens TaxID=208324 RepID=A0ABV0XVA4_9TELE